MAVIIITKDNFKEEVLDSDKPVLIDFFATWCGPCRMVSPVVDEIAEENTNYKICKIDIDEEPNLASEYSVTSVPTLIVLRNGIVTSKSVGAKPKNEILKMLE